MWTLGPMPCFLRILWFHPTQQIMIKMVGNFAGKRANETKPAAERSTSVADHMTKNLVTFRPEQSIEEAMDIMIKKRISGGPVVNDMNELVGVISEGDCLKQVVKGRYLNLPTDEGRVSDHMVKDVVTIEPELDVFQAARKFLDMRIRRFPVLEQGKLVGQISQKDIMKAVMKMKSSTW